MMCYNTSTAKSLEKHQQLQASSTPSTVLDTHDLQWYVDWICSTSFRETIRACEAQEITGANGGILDPLEVEINS